MNTQAPAVRQEFSAISTLGSNYLPARVVEVEIGQPLCTLSAINEETEQRYQRAMCLVRLHTQPLGMVELQFEDSKMDTSEVAQHIWGSLSETINKHLQQDGLPPVTRLDAEGLPSPNTPVCLEERERALTHTPFVSVIVPTHDRPETLEACLRSLLALHYPRYEVIIVDNVPSTHATVDLVQKLSRDAPFIRYVREDHPGASWARNRGIMVARGEILAFTDDDVVVDPYWLVGLVRGFRVAENVACVTGLILPMELETRAQFLFEEYCGFTRGFIRRVFDLKENHPNLPLHPYIAGRFGTGASMAFTTAFIQSVGGFDPALGGAGPVRCSQDIATFFQVITRGYKLVYEPASLLYHLHRRDYIRLRSQIYHYGVGFTAYLVKCFFDNPQLVFDFIGKLPHALFYTLQARFLEGKGKAARYPRELTVTEWRGRLYGPFAYLLSRRAVSRIRKGSVIVEEHANSTVTRDGLSSSSHQR